MEEKDSKENHKMKNSSNTRPFPERRAALLSRLSFSWMNSFVSKGQKNRITRDDLYSIPPKQESKTVGSRFIEIWNREKALENPKTQWGLHKAIFIFSKNSIILSGILDLVKIISGLMSPFILQRLLLYYKDYTNNSAKYENGIFFLLLYCLAMCCTQLFAAFAGNWSIWILVKSGLDVRTGLMSAIYDRSLNLSGIEKKNYSIGRATKMMSSDVLRFEVYWGFLHFFWTCPLQVFLSFCFLYSMFGVSVFAGAAVIALSLPIQFFLLRRMSRQRPKINEVADKRIRLLQEILAGIRVIKLYSWDNIFRTKMSHLREKELKEIRKMRLSSALITTLTLALPVLASVATFVWHAKIRGQILTPALVFPAITFFGRMETPLIIIPIIASYTVDAREAMNRIGKFLRARSSASAQKQVELKDNAVVVKAKFIWELPEGEEDPDQIVFDFDITIPKGSLVAIVGSVGSGKSSFIGAINGEMKQISGNVEICGKIGYCPQQAWIRNCSVRENIIFDQPFDEDRYKAVIEQCALENDIANFPHGDETELGEKGISLSGGQKQRISLARMVYFNPDIAIMDDPLSAVDSQVGSTLFYDCILDGLLKDKTRILVTNQLNILAYVDQIIVLDEGRVVERGTYQELLSKDTDFSDLLKKYSNDESEDEAASDSDSDSESDSDDDSQAPLAKKKEKTAKLHSEEKRDGVSAKVYWAYAKACGGISFLLLASSFMLFTEYSRIIRSFVLRDWTTSPDVGAFDYYILKYSGLAGLQALSACANTCMFVWGGYRAAKVIHEGALAKIIRSPMSFFDSTPVGRILNRFSKDLDVVDSYVAEEFNALIVTFAVIISTVILIIRIDYRMCAILIIPFAIGYFLQSTFRTISRQIQRLNAQNFSPLMSHFSETFAGLGSIRAFQVQERFFSKHHELVDVANRAQLLNLSMRRWVGIRSELMGAMLILVLSVTSIVFNVGFEFMGMLIGDTLNVIEYLDWCIKQFAETEMSLMAVERVNHYSVNLDSEAAEIIESNRPDPSWPAKGHILIQDLVVQYKPSLPPVIKGINLEIQAGEHVAIVGRTGAGKTSIISSLFRILEPTSGSIIIDGIDISTIGLSDLRSKIAIVPQEPALFSGTLRFNLDPYGRYTDDEIWLALERTSMKEAAMDLTDRLDGEVEECGQNFSIGQRQLLCLTRALLLRSSIIVMDEATANIDLETDETIQISLRENFKNSTLITIAHRINTIIDYDRIIVMDSGRVAEFDTPRALLADEDSIFYALASEAGVSLDDE